MPKINVDCAYLNHPKTRRLKLYLDPQADIYPIRLWIFCAEYFYKEGILLGYSGSEIEGILGYTGPAGNLIKALETVGFIKKIGESYAVNDWREHAGFIWDYKRAGKEGAKKRWKSKKRKKTKANSPPNSPPIGDPNAIELNGIELNKYLSEAPSPSGESVESAKPLTDLQRIVKGWKLLTGVPVEGEESKAWDKVHFKRNARSASSLLTLFGGWSMAWDCVEFVYALQKKQKLDCTLETVVKRSDLFREQLARSGR